MSRSEIASRFGVAVATLRNLERQGVLPRITESGSGAYIAALKLYLAARQHLPAATITRAWKMVPQ